MVLGLGTSSTATFVVDKIGSLLKFGELKDIIGIPTSKHTEEQARSLDIPLTTFDDHPLLDLAIDGTDEVDPELNLVKGRGGALLREKMVEAASKSFVMVVDESKLVLDWVGVNLRCQFSFVGNIIWLDFRTCLKNCVGCESKLSVNVEGKPYVTDNFNYIVELYFETLIKDALVAGKEIGKLEGVVEHGLFLDMSTAVIIAGKTAVEVMERQDPALFLAICLVTQSNCFGKAVFSTFQLSL